MAEEGLKWLNDVTLMIFWDQFYILNPLTSSYLVTYKPQMKCIHKHMHMHAHMRVCTKSKFDRIYLLAWIGTA